MEHELFSSWSEETVSLFQRITELCTVLHLENQINIEVVELLVQENLKKTQGRVVLKEVIKDYMMWMLDEGKQVFNNRRLNAAVQMGRKFQLGDQRRLLETREKMNEDPLLLQKRKTK